ncbi:MAG: hypothetical protein JHC87_08790, partial [Thermoleophilaceae bacterium]|nr:hypothetical protein [Thermoleophilaceae bacterium]
MSAPAASGRVQQARALLRNEGLANLIKRLLWLAKQKIYESGPVIWIYRPTTIAEAAPADRLLSVVEATPGSEAQQIANRLRPLAPAIEQLRRDIGGIRILVHDGDINEPIYLAWIYAETGLVADRQAITLDLPQGAAMLEDSFIPRSQRGNRHAPLIMDT